MKNILGTEENLELFNENGIKVYKYYKHSNGFSYEYTRDSNGNELTFKNSKGVSRGFDKTYTPEEVLIILKEFKEYLSFSDEIQEQEWFEQFKKK